VIGPPGIGKTSLIKTLFGYTWDLDAGGWIESSSQDAPVCVVSAEAGLLSVQDLVQAGKVDGFEVTSLDDFRDIYQHLTSSQEAKVKYEGGWVFIDSLTEISDRCNKYFKAKYPQKEKTFDRWDDYQVLMTTLIKGFRDATSYNVVFTCLPLVDKDENNRRFIAPNVVGNGLRQLLTSFFDEVFYFINVQGDDGAEFRTFITGPYERYPGKDRSGRLALFEPPNLLHIKEKILGRKEKNHGAAKS
jgi:hypothetical protein